MSPIVQKIQKLLSLATSANEHEARAAAEQASRLLVKHNLKRQDIQERRDYETRGVLYETRLSTETKFTGPLVRNHFFVNVVQNYRVGKGTTHTFVGEPENVEIAAYVFEFLNREFRSCWKAYSVQTGRPATFRQAYYLGLYRGLDEQLKAASKAVQQTEGLVLVRDPGITNATAIAFPRLHETKSKPFAKDSATIAAGQEKGRTMQIRKGLSSSSTNTTAQIGAGK